MTTNKLRLFSAVLWASSRRHHLLLPLCFYFVSLSSLLFSLLLPSSLPSPSLFLLSGSFPPRLLFLVSAPPFFSVLNSPCPLQDEEVLEELPEEEEDVTPVRTSTTNKEEVRSQSSAAQVGQQQTPADQSEGRTVP